jgi:hypothetical protein
MEIKLPINVVQQHITIIYYLFILSDNHLLVHVLFEKLMLIHLAKKFSIGVEPEG